MLSDEVLERVSERLVDRLEKTNTYILKRMGANIREIRKLNATQAHQLAQILKYGGSYEEILQELMKVTNLNQKDIIDIFEETAKSNYEFTEQFYNYKGIDYIPYDENYALKNQVEAIANLTANNIKQMMNPSVLGYGMINKETGEVTFTGLQQAYYDLIDEAVLSVSQGKETFSEALTRQINAIGNGGMKVIYNSTYMNKEGIILNRSRRLDSAIRMTMKDGLRSLHNENQELFGKEFGADGVEISVHQAPAPDHQYMQGRQFSKEEYNKLQVDGIAKDYEGKIIDINMTSKKGITFHRPVSQYNCYHYVYSIVLGVNSREYTDEQLQEIIDENNKGFDIDGKHYTIYEGTQMQRRLETEIRKAKDTQILARESGDVDLVRESQQRITELTNKYKELSNVSGLPTKMDRMKVSGYKRVDANKIQNSTQRNYIDYGTNNDKIFDDFYDEYETKYNNLTDNQKYAMKKYAGTEYKNMQRVLKGKEDKVDGDLTVKQLKDNIKQLDSILDNNEVGKDVVLYRGTKSKYYINAKVGDIIDTGLYNGASLNTRVAFRFIEKKEDSVMLKILTPKETKGFYVGDYATGIGEQEILLSRKTKFKYIRKEKTISPFSDEEIEQIVLEVVE